MPEDEAQTSAPEDEFPDLPIDSHYEAWELADIEHDLAMYYADMKRGYDISMVDDLKQRFDKILAHNDIPLPVRATWQYNPVLGSRFSTLVYERQVR